MLEREEKRQDFGKIMKGKFPNLVKEIYIEIQEAQRQNIIKMPKLKDKERILKAAREKQRVTYKGVPIRLSADFSKETLQARRKWQEILKVLKTRD